MRLAIAFLMAAGAASCQNLLLDDLTTGPYTVAKKIVEPDEHYAPPPSGPARSSAPLPYNFDISFSKFAIVDFHDVQTIVFGLQSVAGPFGIDGIEVRVSN